MVGGEGLDDGVLVGVEVSEVLGDGRVCAVHLDGDLAEGESLAAEVVGLEESGSSSGVHGGWSCRLGVLVMGLMVCEWMFCEVCMWRLEDRDGFGQCPVAAPEPRGSLYFGQSWVLWAPRRGAGRRRGAGPPQPSAAPSPFKPGTGSARGSRRDAS